MIEVCVYVYQVLFIWETRESGDINVCQNKTFNCYPNYILCRVPLYLTVIQLNLLLVIVYCYSVLFCFFPSLLQGKSS